MRNNMSIAKDIIKTGLNMVACRLLDMQSFRNYLKQ
jgi:hypothetical protein